MKLRKMLGDIHSESYKELMKIMETQSKQTLAQWAIHYSRENYYPIFLKYQSISIQLEKCLIDCLSVSKGNLNDKEIKDKLKEARKYFKDIHHPIEEAALRAIITACGTIQTPTNALGFLFYGCATKAYDVAEIENNQAVYDELAEKELQNALKSLRIVAIDNEENPVKIKWNC